MIENEFKIMLSAAQYAIIRDFYEWDDLVSQTNHYFDTDELDLRGRRITCRAREIAGEYFLQLKLPADEIFSRVELEKRLDFLPAEIIGEELCGLAENVDFPDVKRLGALHTNRLVKRFRGAEIDLDESEYFGITDYELEIEFTDEIAARKLLAEVLDIIGENRSEEVVCRGKIQRFIDEFLRNK